MSIIFHTDIIFHTLLFLIKCGDYKANIEQFPSLSGHSPSLTFVAACSQKPRSPVTVRPSLL